MDMLIALIQLFAAAIELASKLLDFHEGRERDEKGR
jgi:hypothetical protein